MKFEHHSWHWVFSIFDNKIDRIDRKEREVEWERDREREKEREREGEGDRDDYRERLRKRGVGVELLGFGARDPRLRSFWLIGDR